MGMTKNINSGGGGASGGGGEIVQVQGGHIVRSTGRKDRHSKVSTAKGPRDRRVRLSAHTAIQFYDVQDRLGYDRPSKAVDWLIKKAKSAIDNLAELPPWNPTAADVQPPVPDSDPPQMDPTPPDPYDIYHHRAHPPPHLAESDSAAGLSFFPTAASHGGVSFPNYPSDHLGLSLQSFHGDVSAPEQFGFGSGGSSFQRMLTWPGGGHDATTSSTSGGGGFNAAVAAFNGNYQRGTLQSSNSFSQLVRAWDDLPSSMAAEASSTHDHKPHQQQLHQVNQSSSSIFGTRFVSDAAGAGGFPMFCIPARIHGEVEGDQHGVVSERPSSSSSDRNSCHH